MNIIQTSPQSEDYDEMSQDDQISDSKKYITFGKPKRKLILNDLKQGLEQMEMWTSGQEPLIGDKISQILEQAKGDKFNKLLHKVLSKHVSLYFAS